MTRLDKIEESLMCKDIDCLLDNNKDFPKQAVKNIQWLTQMLKKCEPYVSELIDSMEWTNTGYGDSPVRNKSIEEAKELLKEIQG